MAPHVHASFGGELMSLMMDLVKALGDVAITVVQLGITGEWHYAVDSDNRQTHD